LELNRKNIDPFEEALKKVAQEEHFEFNPEAWDKMEQKLNSKSYYFNFKKIILYFSLIILFLICCLFLFYKNSVIEKSELGFGENSTNNASLINKSKRYSLKDEDYSILNENSFKKTDKVINHNVEKNSLNENFNNLIRYKLKIANDSIKNNTKIYKLFTSKNQGLKNIVNSFKEFNKESDLTYSVNSDISNNSASQPINLISENEKIEDLQNQPIFSSLNSTSIDSSFNLFNPNWFIDFPVQSIVLNDFSQDSITNNLIKKYLIAQIGLHNIMFNQINPSNISVNLGLNYGFLFRDKFEISIGLQYFNDNFSIQREGGKKLNNYWVQNSSLEMLKTNMHLCEIPVIANYIYNPKINRYKFVIGVGLNNTLILNEKYQFSYNDANPTLPISWQQNFGQFTPLSSFIFQLGIDKVLDNKTNLGLYPFINVPVNFYGLTEEKYYRLGLKLVWKISR
jgi:hypothetical protein